MLRSIAEGTPLEDRSPDVPASRSPAKPGSGPGGGFRAPSPTMTWSSFALQRGSRAGRGGAANR